MRRSKSVLHHFHRTAQEQSEMSEFDGVIGIDLGTAYSCVGVCQNERAETVASDQVCRFLMAVGRCCFVVVCCLNVKAWHPTASNHAQQHPATSDYLVRWTTFTTTHLGYRNPEWWIRAAGAHWTPMLCHLYLTFCTCTVILQPFNHCRWYHWHGGGREIVPFRPYFAVGGLHYCVLPCATFYLACACEWCSSFPACCAILVGMVWWEWCTLPMQKQKQNENEEYLQQVAEGQVCKWSGR